MKILNNISRFIRNSISNDVQQRKEDNSIVINDIDLISSFLANPDFPWLISFPRTGSHWLRMIMEMYFEKPSLVRIFFYKDADSFTCFHRHDTYLKINGCRNIIYLYRNPVDTIFSQISFNNEDIHSLPQIEKWTILYGKHLSKWLLEETFTKKKTVITYEEMKEDIYSAFGKICSHFDISLDQEKLFKVLPKISKEKLKKITEDEPRTVNVETSYNDLKSQFRKKYSSMIYDLILEENKKLKSYFQFNNKQN